MDKSNNSGLFPISYFAGKINANVTAKNATIADFITHTKDTSKKASFEKLRYLYEHDNKQYKEEKKSLHYFSLAGIIQEGKERNTGNWIGFNGVLHCEYDHIPKEEIQLVKNELISKIPSLVYVVVSPSGCGLKFGVRVYEKSRFFNDNYHPENYSPDWIAGIEYLKEAIPSYIKYLDQSLKDKVKACFETYDEEAYYNEQAEILPIEELRERYKLKPTAKNNNNENDANTPQTTQTAQGIPYEGEAFLGCYTFVYQGVSYEIAWERVVKFCYAKELAERVVSALEAKNMIKDGGTGSYVSDSGKEIHYKKFRRAGNCNDSNDGNNADQIKVEYPTGKLTTLTDKIFHDTLIPKNFAYDGGNGTFVVSPHAILLALEFEHDKDKFLKWLIEEQGFSVSAFSSDVQTLLYGNELETANYFRNILGRRFLYVYEEKSFREYRNGCYYPIDVKQVEAVIKEGIEKLISRAEKVVSAFKKRNDAITDTDTAKERKKLVEEKEKAFQSAKKAKGQTAYVKKIVEALTMNKEYCVHFTDFDEVTTHINFLNGFFDGKTKTFLEHQESKELFATQVPYNFDFEKFAEYGALDFEQRQAKHPKWTQFLQDVFHDEETIDFLQAYTGTGLLGIQPKYFAYLYGSGGNGKGTFFQILENILNNVEPNKSSKAETHKVSYYGIMNGQAFTRNGASEDLRTRSVGTVKHCRIVVGKELPMKATADETFIKDIVSEGEALKYRQIYQDEITFRPKFTLFLQGNELLNINDFSDGFWRRIALIECKGKFADRTQSKDDFVSAFYEEREYILFWLLFGAFQFLEEGLQLPNVISENNKTYRNEENLAYQYIQERCTVTNDDSDKVQVSVAYKDFMKWRKDFGIQRNLTLRAFGKSLREAKLKVEAGTANKTYVHGVTINDDDTELNVGKGFSTSYFQRN